MSEINTIVIKKYPNRRLYNTNNSKYITLADLAEFVRKDINFKVTDTKSGIDITGITLAQVLLEQEINGYSLLPIELIKVMIKYSDHPMHKLFTRMITQHAENFNNFLEKMPNNPISPNSQNPDLNDYWKQLGDMNKAFLKLFLNKD